MKKPDWNKWRYIEEVSTVEAVLLAMDIDPSEYKNGSLNFGFYRHGLPKNLEKVEQYFNDSRELTERAVTSARPKFKYANFRHNEYGSAFGVFNISEFAKWWKSIGRELPEEFPQGEPEKSNQQNEIDRQRKELSNALKVIAMLLRFIGRQCKKNQSAISEEIANNEEYRIDGIGKRSIDGIFSSANKELGR